MTSKVKKSDQHVAACEHGSLGTGRERLINLIVGKKLEGDHLASLLSLEHSACHIWTN
jgi:hypothetical protein